MTAAVNRAVVDRGPTLRQKLAARGLDGTTLLVLPSVALMIGLFVWMRHLYLFAAFIILLIVELVVHYFLV